MRRRNPRPHAPDLDSSLLIQPDLGGGQRPREAHARPRGTAPVGAFVGPLTCSPPDPGASGPWRVEPGEAWAAAEDGVPGSNAVRFEDALEQGVVPGVEASGRLVRGSRYDGPERRKHQSDWELWQCRDRRDPAFVYAGDQQV